MNASPTAASNRRAKRVFTLFLVAVPVGYFAWHYGPLLYAQNQIVRLGGTVEYQTSLVIGGIGGHGPNTYGPGSSAWDQLRIIRQEIHRLSLSGSQINDDNFPRVCIFSSIVDLDLAGTRITSKTVKSVSCLKHLERLNLDGTSFQDGDIINLRRLKKLETLCLDNTLISDAGLSALADIPTLRLVICRRTRVTDDGVKKAQLKNPAIEIVHRDESSE